MSMATSIIAQHIATCMVRKVQGIEGICLFGSVARGDENEWSDVDLLVIGRGPEIRPSQLLSAVPRRSSLPRISLLYYPTADFLAHYREGDLFVGHVRLEGKALHDPHGLIRSVLEAPFNPRVDVRQEIQLQLDRIDAYKDLSRFNRNFLFCLAHLYSIGKGVVMLGLANVGIFEFRRDRAFEIFRRTYNGTEGELQRLSQARPFYAVVTRRKPDPLPFDYHNAEGPVAGVIEAIEHLAEIILS